MSWARRPRPGTGPEAHTSHLLKAESTRRPTISSQEEHDFVRQLTLDSSAVRVYLGLRHQPPYSETICTWGDGSPLVFAKWGDSDPYAVRV